MIFDTHAHYDDEAFDEDRDQIIDNVLSKTERLVNVSSNLKTCRQTMKLIQKYTKIYGAIGVHPNETSELNEDNFKVLSDYLDDEKIVAIGEIGLDYYWDEPEREVQKKWFDMQLELAKIKRKPIIIHSRNAAKDTLDMIKSSDVKKVGGVIHCFSYSVEMAREYVDMGFYIGVGGVVTFKNAKILKDVVDYLPIDRIVIETDCPYLSPEPNRGKRNSSLMLPYVVEKIAEIKGKTVDEIEEATYKNAMSLYKFI